MKIVRRAIVETIAQSTSRAGPDGEAIADAVVDRLLLDDAISAARRTFHARRDIKNWWRSKGIWGGLLAIAGGATGLGELLGLASMDDSLGTLLPTLAASLGGALAIVGRLNAKTSIH